MTIPLDERAFLVFYPHSSLQVSLMLLMIHILLTPHIGMSGKHGAFLLDHKDLTLKRSNYGEKNVLKKSDNISLLLTLS